MKKRVLSMFMALALCLTLLPAPAFAEGAEIAESGAAQVTTAGGTEQVRLLQRCMVGSHQK